MRRFEKCRDWMVCGIKLVALQKMGINSELIRKNTDFRLIN